MAVFSSIACADMAGIISGIKAFLLQNGFSLSGESAAGGMIRWTASKGARSHTFTGVKNGKYPLSFGDTSQYTGWLSSVGETFSSSLGIRSAGFSAADISFITGELAFPCRMDMFVLNDADVFITFQLDASRWVHLYSGGIDKSIAGSWDGGELFSGSTFPSAYRDSSDSEYTYTGLFNVNSIYGKGIVERTCIACKIEGSWTGGRKSRRSWADPYIKAGMLYSSLCYGAMNQSSTRKTMDFIANGSKNALTGLPVLFPIRFFRVADNKYLGKVPDIYMCSGTGYEPGSELALGQHSFRLYPLHNKNRSNLFFAVRSS